MLQNNLTQARDIHFKQDYADVLPVIDGQPQENVKLHWRWDGAQYQSIAGVAFLNVFWSWTS